MMLPILRITIDQNDYQDYFLFQDVLCAVTHLTTQMTGETDEKELKQMPIDNQIIRYVEKERKTQITEIMEKHPSLKHLQYNSAHLAFVKILTQMIRKRNKLRK